MRAWPHNAPARCRYFFKVLDVENRGVLSAAVVDAWCTHVRAVAVDAMAAVYEYNASDVKDEIFDMVKPQDAERGLTVDDLMASKLADTICGILVDGQCHTDYDRREALQAQAQEEDGYSWHWKRTGTVSAGRRRVQLSQQEDGYS